MLHVFILNSFHVHAVCTQEYACTFACICVTSPNVVNGRYNIMYKSD